MSGARVPRAGVRFGRRGLRLLSLVLLAFVFVAASGMQTAAADLLQRTLNAHWRGAYDILVTAPGHSPLPNGDATLLSPDELTDASLGHVDPLKEQELAAIPGVGVVAPVGEISLPVGEDDDRASVTIPLDGASSTPMAYKIVSSLRVADGVGGTRTVKSTGYYIVDQSAWRGFNRGGVWVTPDDSTPPLLIVPPRVVSSTGEADQGEETNVALDFDAFFSTFDTQLPAVGTGIAVVDLPVPAIETAHVVLVDPVAEQKLLGKKAGAFLNPLVKYSRLIGTRSQKIIDLNNPPPPNADLQVLYDDDYLGYVSPILTKSDDPLAGKLTVTLSKLAAKGADLKAALTPQIPAKVSSHTNIPLGKFPKSQVESAPVTSTTTLFSAEVGSRLSPLSISSVNVGWLDYTPPKSATYEETPGLGITPTIMQNIDPHWLAASPVTVSSGTKGEVGHVAPSGKAKDGESAFGTLETVAGLSNSPDIPQLWPVGTYSSKQLRSTTDSLSRIGLGYDFTTPVVTRDSDGNPIAPESLAPSLTGLGLNESGAVAIADIKNAGTWHVDNPISSVRVRVAGITTYTPAAQKKILDVADSIRKLGLTATIVAGSSPEGIPTLVSDYAFANGHTGTLGYITTDFSRLGAAAKAEQGVSGTSAALLLMGILSSAALLTAVQLSSIPGRRRDSVVLRQIGWRRRRIVRWLFAEELLALLVLALAGGGAVLLSNLPVTTLQVVGVILVVGVLTSLLLVSRGSLAERVRVRARASMRSLVLTRTAQLGLRQARTFWGSTVTLGMALLLVFAASATTAIVIIEGRDTAGASNLGVFATAQGWLPQGALVFVTLVSSAVLIVVVRRMSLERRRTQLDAMRAMGWRRRHIGQAAVAELLCSGIPALVLGVAVTIYGASVTVDAALPAALVAGGTVSVLVFALVLAASLRPSAR